MGGSATSCSSYSWIVLGVRVSPPSVPLAWLKRQIPQLEVALFLSLHGRDRFRSAQISRCRHSCGLHPREDGSDGSPTLLPQEYIRLGKSGAATSDGEFFATLKHQSMKLQIQPLSDMALADIKPKITQDNVMYEAFSSVTAG